MILRLLRVKHWVKNFLIFLPAFFISSLSDINIWLTLLLGFVSFSFISSSVYIINDINDKESDRRHPTKQFRPIASGKVMVKTGIIISLILLFLSLIINFYLGSVPSLEQNHHLLTSSILLLTYFFINICYSFFLKHIPLLDVLILSFGYLLRLYYGSIITNTNISNWLYLVVFAFSFYLGLSKRRGELTKKTQRKVMKFYTKDFLDKNIYVFQTLTITFYSLWTLEKINTGSSQFLLLTIPLIILICMRYSMIIENISDADPIEVLTKDIPLIIFCFFYILLMIGVIYII